MQSVPPPTVMSADEINAYLDEVFPQLNKDRKDYTVTEVYPGGCTVRLTADARHLRPGDTVSGPALFTLADIGGYACALAHVGRQALAVTTSLNINFMRKAGPGPIDGKVRLLKLGRSLMVFDIDMTLEGALVAHATGTYSIPPMR